MPRIFAADAADHKCPWNGFTQCFGSECMAWQWHGPLADRCETDNLVETEEGPRPLGVPKAPEGDGWAMDGQPYQKSYHQSAKLGLPKATGQRWIRQRLRSEGSCGRSMVDQDHIPW